MRERGGFRDREMEMEDRTFFLEKLESVFTKNDGWRPEWNRGGNSRRTRKRTAEWGRGFGGAKIGYINRSYDKRYRNR